MLIGQDDRRLFQRMTIETKVNIVMGNIELEGICKELSSTGMSFEIAQDSFKAGDKVVVNLGTQDSRFPPFTAEAEVLRIVKAQDNYNMALIFSSVN